jgi:gliding motility-associated-like protein
LREFYSIDTQTLLHMIKRIVPIALFLLTASFAIAQSPKAVKTGKHDIDAFHSSSMVCPPGSNPDAGISTQSLFPNAQSNDILFLCLGDSMDILHFGGNLSGDPQPASAPGFSYVFYSCLPTVSGPSEASILLDACHIAPPNITAVQAGVDINGNATFFNNGQIQNTFNAGVPMTVWFAPITLDDFASFGTEQDPNTGEQGPCMDINTADAFTVTYLNAIEGIDINTSTNGDCVGSFTATGGLPEFDGSNYTNIIITLSSDPSVEADINGANFTHGDTIEFTVPQSGTYDVLIEDGKSCAASFTINMTACQDVVYNASEEFAAPGSTVCVTIDVSNFIDVLSFQFTIQWDPAVLQLPTPLSTSVNNLGTLNDIFFGPGTPTNSLTVSWSDADFSGESLPDNTGIFEICFTVVGPVGSSTPITFSGNLTQIEVLNSSFQPIGFISQLGSVTVSGPLTVTFTSCSSPSTGSNTGTFMVTSSGGVPPYSYSWVNTMNAGIFGSGNISLNGGSDVVGDGMPAGDVPLAPGTFEVIIIDDVGIADTATVQIFDAPQLTVAIVGTAPTCSNTADGTFYIDALGGGTAPYNIVWSTMETGVDTIFGLTGANYSVSITDATGCVAIAQNGILTTPIVVDTTTLQHVTCNGPGNDGAITVEATGGTLAPGSDYNYAWDNAAFGQNISFLTPGVYCVSVTDDNSCEVVQCFTINASAPPIIVNWDSISVSCPLDMNGELTVNVIAGNSAIDSYTWDPAQPGADETITGLGPGTYYVSITAVDGCFVVDSVTLYAPTILTYDSSQVQSPTCPGDVNGSVTVFVSGGTAPYFYSWSNLTTSNFPLLPGLVGDSTYTVTVTDSGNCGDTIIESILLENPPEIIVEFANIQGVNCNGGIPCDGQAIAIASGGTENNGMYNFNWPSGETFSGVSQSTAMNLCQGLLTLEVNDGICSVTADTMISFPSPLQVDLNNSSTTPTSCFGTSDGAAFVQATGGIPGYDYQWINPNIIGQNISNVPAGIYDLLITDANGCPYQTSVEVNQPELLVATMIDTLDASCAGLADGMLDVSWTGGNPGNATYAWTNIVSTTSEADNLPAGFYTVTVTDINGCNDIATGLVSEPPPIIFVLDTIVDPLCFGFQTFITIDTAYGGTDGFNPPYTFSVDGGAPQSISGSIPVLAGNHTVAVFDNNNNNLSSCSSDTMVSINQPTAVNVSFSNDIEMIELGDSIELEPLIQSLLIDSIIWSPLTALNCVDSACSSVFVMPLETTTYSVTVIDANGCIGTDNVIVEVDKNRNVFIPNIFTPNDDGVNDVFKAFTGAGVQKINFMRVFDRWGALVFQADDFIPLDFGNPGWDGYFKGKLMNPGVFVYLIEVEFVDGIVLLYRGDVTLVVH